MKKIGDEMATCHKEETLEGKTKSPRAFTNRFSFLLFLPSYNNHSLSFPPGPAGGGRSDARNGQDADQPLGASLQGDQVSSKPTTMMQQLFPNGVLGVTLLAFVSLSATLTHSLISSMHW